MCRTISVARDTLTKDLTQIAQIERRLSRGRKRSRHHHEPRIEGNTPGTLQIETSFILVVRSNQRRSNDECFLSVPSVPLWFKIPWFTDSVVHGLGGSRTPWFKDSVVEVPRNPHVENRKMAPTYSQSREPAQ